MASRRLILIGLSLIAVIVVSGLVILYENGIFTPGPPPPTLPHAIWQNTLLHSAYELAVADGRVFTSDSDLVNSFDAKSGRLLWRIEQGDYFGRWLVVSGSRVYVGHVGAKVVCLAENTGEFQWIFGAPYTSGRFAKSAPSYLDVVDGRVFAYGDGLTVHDGTTGELLWEYPERPYNENLTDTPYLVSAWPLEGSQVYGEAAFAGESGGVFLCRFDPDNGTLLWKVSEYFMLGGAHWVT